MCLWRLLDLKGSVRLVIRAGFEPTTHSLEGCCSIQLSYRTSPYLLLANAKIIDFHFLTNIFENIDSKEISILLTI